MEIVWIIIAAIAGALGAIIVNYGLFRQPQEKVEQGREK